MRVLLVSVGAGTASIVETSLADRQHEQMASPTGAEGIALVAISPPPLILVEDPLPDMGAADFCRRIRASNEGVHVVILVITHHDNGLPALLDAGADGLLVTSLGPHALDRCLLMAERLVAHHAMLWARAKIGDPD